MKNHGDFKYLGGTLDDAAGEAFDKVARLIGLSKYLGGVELSNLAASCKTNTIQGVLPRPMLDKDNYDFSFSGLKTAVYRLVEKISDLPKDVVACEFQEAVVDVLVEKTIKAAVSSDVKTILLGGGVSANKLLRTRLAQKSLTKGIKLHMPELKYCGDTAAYIASAAYFNNYPKPLNEIVPNPSLGILD